MASWIRGSPMTDTTRDSAMSTDSVVPITTDPTGGPERPLAAPAKGEKARSLGSDAWDELRHRPMFWISAALIALFGIMAGYRAGWIDSVLSRIGEIFLGIPLLLGGILFLFIFPNDPLTTPFLVQVSKVALVLGIFGWPSIMRLMRSSVLQVKPNDYVQAARALGASPARIINSHILPNSLASVIVVSTINLGAFIAAEATLSFLGVGLQPPAISWGIQISEASGIGMIRAAPHMLLFPSVFLSLTVLAFIMLGDVVRDAIDPRLR